MNYSKSIRKKSIAKRILISWCIVAAIFFILGGIVGGIIGSTANKPQPEHITNDAEPQETEIPVYGTYDGRHFEREISIDWSSGDLDFTPLDVPLDADLQEFIFYLCEGYNIDFTFVMGQIQQESSFQVDAIGKTGDYGLMQINQKNFPALSAALWFDDFLDPYNNVRAGILMDRQLFEKYDDPHRVLMAYNMGEYGASVLWEQGVFESNYSRKVLQNQANLQEMLKGVQAE